MQQKPSFEEKTRFLLAFCTFFVHERKIIKKVLASLLEVGGQHFNGACEFVFCGDCNLNVAFGQ